MKKRIARIISILLLVIFLIPSTGMMLYVHHCNSSNTTFYHNLAPESCCGDGVCAVAHNANESSGELVIKPLPCCSDKELFIKLTEHILTQTIKFFSGDELMLPVKEISMSWTSDYDSFNNRCFSIAEDPPESSLFILISSLRL